VDDTFADRDRWIEKFQDAYAKLGTASTETSPLSEDVSDLPLTEVAATHGDSRRLAIMLTGDGGFADLDRGVSDQLSAAGVPVVALSSLRYFWSEQQPAHAARDLERIIDHYLSAWHKDRVLLIGYSFGANVLPFVVPQMSGAYRDRIEALILLGPAPHTSFEIRVADWIPGNEPEGTLVAPEIAKLKDMKTLCIYGADETDSLCPLLPPSVARAVEMPGDHHFDDDAAGLGRYILDFANP
jgi:type IV secretory pathway VirJ component